MAALASRDPCVEPDLRHLRRLTDDFGVYQHTTGGDPQPAFGYALDDVARALIVVVETERLFKGREVPPQVGGAKDTRTLRDLADRYLRFIARCQRPDGRFHNFVSGAREFQDDAGSLDACGRAVWALGVAARHPVLGAQAAAIFQRARPNVHHLPHPRSKAFSLLGLLAALDERDAADAHRDAVHLVTDLLHLYQDAATDDWPWFEDALRYSNGILPYALLTAARNSAFGRREPELAGRARTIGLQSLDFLLRTCTHEGLPAPIGNRGWYRRGEQRALYDQQCVDAADMVLACAEAWAVTREERYREAALEWWSWFFGNNTQHAPLVRPEDGAVFDGLTENGVNENRGAESVVVFLLAHLKLAETFCTRSAR